MQQETGPWVLAVRVEFGRPIQATELWYLEKKPHSAMMLGLHHFTKDLEGSLPFQDWGELCDFNVEVVDFGVNNLASIFRRRSVTPTVSTDPISLEQARSLDS